jgi:hypothetical protein
MAPPIANPIGAGRRRTFFISQNKIDGGVFSS